MIRDATTTDAAQCAAIYAPYVAHTTFSLEETPPDRAEMARRIEQAQHAHAWLVREEEGLVIGYAYGAPFRSRAGFRWTCEVSVYVMSSRQGRGTGRALYAALLTRLAALDYRCAVACLVEPHSASAALHRSTGFARVGTFRSVGFKHGGWRDVTFYERSLTAGSGSSTERQDG
ncbi:MAG: N-acetyltransferase family protein [Dermatophilaceae bacterium]